MNRSGLRGAVNFEDGDLAAALADLSRAIELNPDPAVLFNRGAVHQAMNDWAAAAHDFDQVLAMDPDEADARLRRAQCRVALGDHDGTDADIRAFSSWRLTGPRRQHPCWSPVAGRWRQPPGRRSPPSGRRQTRHPAQRRGGGITASGSVL